jgi:putative transposase
MVRHNLNYVSWKQRKEVEADLKSIFQASTVEMAEKNLDAFAAKWDASHPTLARSWRSETTGNRLFRYLHIRPRSAKPSTR